MSADLVMLARASGITCPSTSDLVKEAATKLADFTPTVPDIGAVSDVLAAARLERSVHTPGQGETPVAPGCSRFVAAEAAYRQLTPPLVYFACAFAAPRSHASARVVQDLTLDWIYGERLSETLTTDATGKLYSVLVAKVLELDPSRIRALAATPTVPSSLRYDRVRAAIAQGAQPDLTGSDAGQLAGDPLTDRYTEALAVLGGATCPAQWTSVQRPPVASTPDDGGRTVLRWATIVKAQSQCSAQPLAASDRRWVTRASLRVAALSQPESSSLQPLWFAAEARCQVGVDPHPLLHGLASRLPRVSAPTANIEATELLADVRLANLSERGCAGPGWPMLGVAPSS